MENFLSQKALRIFVGIVLVLAGGIFLLQQFISLPVGAMFIALLFVAGGSVFILALLKDHSRWWAVIPGYTLIGLGAMIAVSKLFPRGIDRFGGSIFLGAIALSFLTILLMKRDQWWPMIPAGVLATLAIVAGLGNIVQNLGGVVFFLGLGFTFFMIPLWPSGKKEKWAYIPGGIMLALGLMIAMFSGMLLQTWLGWVIGVAFLFGGAFMIFRSARKQE
jgi:hypothetical protein